jgi:tRNA(His) 5'-end guanylyltransferase
MKKKDSLGDRMKERYEDRSRFFLPRRSPVIIRVDGKAFHTFTRGMKRPFDANFMKAMDNTCVALTKEIQGSVCGFVQSDEISVLLCDYQKRDSDAWFDYNVQKMASIAAATATAAFSQEMGRDVLVGRNPVFDARCFSIPDVVEVHNYFVWRQKDCERNSIQMVAQSNYSQKQLHGKSCADMHEMLHAKGVNWNDFTPREKRGGFCYRTQSGIIMDGAPIFSKTDLLKNCIPVQGYEE